MKPTHSNRKCRICGTISTPSWVDFDYCLKCVPEGQLYLATINVRYYGDGYIANAARHNIKASSTCSALVAATRCLEKLVKAKFPNSSNPYLIEEPVEGMSFSRFMVTEKAPF